MKAIYLTLLVLTVVALSYAFVTAIQRATEERLQRSEIEALKKSIEAKEKALTHAYDSLAQTKILFQDSLREARDLKLKDEKTVKTKTESHEKIVFSNLNDSARHSKLAKFYPSYKHP